MDVLVVACEHVACMLVSRFCRRNIGVSNVANNCC